MGFSVYIRRAVEDGKLIFPGNPKLYGYCLRCEDHKHGEKYKCLQCLKRSKSPHSYSAQYFNDPIDSESVEFKTQWIKRFTFTPDLTSRLKITPGILSIDPAVSLQATNDYTGIVISKILPGSHVYIVYAEQARLSPPELIAKVFSLRKLFNIQKVLLETTASQLVFVSSFRQEMIKRKEFFVIEEVGRSTIETKAMRIRGLLPFYANGMVEHRMGLDDLEYQMIQFPRNTHDDILDALSRHVPYWKKLPFSSRNRDDCPPGSLNWWKKQVPGKAPSHIEELFGDLM